MGKIWFTADTYFGSERAFELSRRPFNNVDDMDKTIISRWNNVVDKNDMVYHLGDFGDYSNVKLLNGQITLVLGNYELKSLKEYYSGYSEYWRKFFESAGFASADHYATLAVNNELWTMRHKPIDCEQDRFNLFGHIHRLCMVKFYGLNVGTDCHNFTPIDIETVKFYKNAIETHYDDNVFK